MKAINWIFVLSFFLILIFSCKGKNEIKPIDLERAVYQRAMKASDVTTALNAAYRIVVLSPEETNYYDSIAQLLYVSKNYHGAIEVSKNAIKDHANTLLYSILANSSYNIGQYSDASIYYQDLMRVDSVNKVQYLYDIGTCFYNMNNYETTFNYMKKVMDEDQSRMMKKQFITNGQYQEVYYYVAALNTMGVVYMHNKEYEKAEQLYTELFKIDSTFLLANNNYTLLNNLIKSQP